MLITNLVVPVKLVLQCSNYVLCLGDTGVLGDPYSALHCVAAVVL